MDLLESEQKAAADAFELQLRTTSCARHEHQLAGVPQRKLHRRQSVIDSLTAENARLQLSPQRNSRISSKRSPRRLLSIIPAHAIHVTRSTSVMNHMLPSQRSRRWRLLLSERAIFSADCTERRSIAVSDERYHRLDKRVSTAPSRQSAARDRLTVRRGSSRAH